MITTWNKNNKNNIFLIFMVYNAKQDKTKDNFFLKCWATIPVWEKWFCISTILVSNLLHLWLSDGECGSKWVWSMLNIHHGKWHGKIMAKKYVVWLRENNKKCFGGSLHNVFIIWYMDFWPMVFYCPWYLSMVFWPIFIFRVFWSFLERVGINHNKCSSSFHLWGRNNDVLEHI